MTSSKHCPNANQLPRSVDRRAMIQKTASLALAGVVVAPFHVSARTPASVALDRVLKKHVESKSVPFTVGMVANSREIIYQGQYGDAAPGVAAHPATMMRIFSMTKAIGAVAGMILIERGTLDFDTPVREIIPEFSEIQVLDRYEGDKPIFRTPASPVLVRHLATHTSGLSYDQWNAKMKRWSDDTKNPGLLSGKREYLFTPLMFDPGTQWSYGTGIDWIGEIVEKIDGRSIDVFCREEIFEPLRLNDTVFEIDAERESRLAQVKSRSSSGDLLEVRIRPPSHPETYGMGHALYSTPSDYLRFCRAILGRGHLDGNRVLKSESVTRMLASHSRGIQMQKMRSLAPGASADFDPFPEVPKTFSFGFMRNEQNVPGMRSVGSQSWAGICNTHFWIDPEKDIAAVLMTQTLPFADPRFMALYADFERSVYQHVT